MSQALNSTLNYRWNEVNPWFEATKYYSLCYQRYFETFDTFKDWNEELKRADVNTVCKKELEAMRTAATGINYKQVLGQNRQFLNHTQD